MLMHAPPPPPPQPMPITIFVHGTQMHALFEDVDMRSVLPPVSQTPAGLTLLKDLPSDHLVPNMLHALSASDTKEFPLEGLYTFGWSGSIKVDERCSAGKELYNLISALSKEYSKMHGSTPHITLISHSHGGNVVLHMADHHTEDQMLINRAILLACPVQNITAGNACSPLFQRIYSIHSHDDIIQTMDQESLQIFRTFFTVWKTNKEAVPFPDALYALRHAAANNTWKLGSERHFNSHANLVQVSVAWQKEPKHAADHIEKGFKVELAAYGAKQFFSNFKNFSFTAHPKRGVLHTEFTTPLFFQTIPLLLKNISVNHPNTEDNPPCISHFIAG